MSVEATRIGLVGLPETGKSTYLVALWNAVQTKSDTHTLCLERYPEAAVHLNAMHARWLRGESVGRTPRGGSELVSLALRYGDNVIDLEVPDLSGETFEHLVVERHLDTTVDSLLSAATGILLFVHPDQLRSRITIAQARAMGVDVGGGTPAQLDRRNLPAELHAVDLLQALTERRVRTGESGLRRTVIMVSAWDQVDAENRPPAAWVRSRMPMLHSYLEAQHGQSYRVAGVSAQGGQAGPTIGQHDPLTRSWVVDGDGAKHHDIASPLLWAAGLVS